MSPHLRKIPYQQEDQPGWRGSFEAKEKSAATGFRRAKQRVTCTTGGHCCSVLPSLRCSSTVGGTSSGAGPPSELLFPCWYPQATGMVPRFVPGVDVVQSSLGNKSPKSIFEGQGDLSQELHSAGGNRDASLGGAPGEMRLAMAHWCRREDSGGRGYKEYLISLSSCRGRYFGDGKYRAKPTHLWSNYGQTYDKGIQNIQW